MRKMRKSLNGWKGKWSHNTAWKDVPCTTLEHFIPKRWNLEVKSNFADEKGWYFIFQMNVCGI